MEIGCGDPTVPKRTRKNMCRPRKRSKITNLIDDLSQLPNLPEEIIVDIFSRLPVKSLLKFRCVSKSWRSLISDPYFIKKHLHMSSTNTNYHNHRLMLVRADPVFNFKSVSLHFLFNEPHLDVTEFNQPFEEYVYLPDDIVGSCNGLLCIVINNDTIYLWNPSTRETRQVLKLLGNIVVHGFGYDSSRDDYKLMATFYHCGVGEANVYTLSTNSWRRIEKSPIKLPGKPGIFVGGALIWSMVDFGDEPGPLYVYWKIVAFDLANETYQEVPQPMREDGAYVNTLGVLGGSLCLLANYRGTHSALWVMEDYGVKESWTKLITIPCFQNLWYFEFLSRYTPIWFLKKGELLANFKHNLGVYGLNNNTLSPGIYYFHASLQSSVYVESLVSPNLIDHGAVPIVGGKRNLHFNGKRAVNSLNGALT